MKYYFQLIFKILILQLNQCSMLENNCSLLIAISIKSFFMKNFVSNPMLNGDTINGEILLLLIDICNSIVIWWYYISIIARFILRKFCFFSQTCDSLCWWSSDLNSLNLPIFLLASHFFKLIHNQLKW